jgi:hypothetical protein
MHVGPISIGELLPIVPKSRKRRLPFVFAGSPIAATEPLGVAATVRGAITAMSASWVAGATTLGWQ